VGSAPDIAFLPLSLGVIPRKRRCKKRISSWAPLTLARIVAFLGKIVRTLRILPHECESPEITRGAPEEGRRKVHIRSVVIQFCIVRKIMLDDRSRRDYGRFSRNQVREGLPHLQAVILAPRPRSAE
jgi:hypothetical protein